MVFEKQSKIILFATKRFFDFAAKGKLLLRQKDFSPCCKTKKSFCRKKIFILQQKDFLFAAKIKGQNDFLFAAKM